MIRLKWNALGVGDHVRVHDEGAPGMPLVPGRVIGIEKVVGSNVVDIRISPVKGPSKVVRPRRLTVHPEHLDLDEHCWRCAVRPVGA